MDDKTSTVVDVLKTASGKCDVRLSPRELQMLHELVEQNDVTKSDIMRQALRFFHKWCTEK